MFRRYFFAGGLLLFSTFSFSQNTDYKLVWSDEFNQDGKPDSTNWGFEKGFVRNHEHQWYQEDNAFCTNGYLIIEARSENKPNPGYKEGSKDWRKSREKIEATSSSLLTRGKHSWQYGRFEMRAKLDVSPGMWPAFWTLGDHDFWPACGEIDIMEYYRGMILANAAWAGSGHTTHWDAETKQLSTFDDPKWSEKFHVWRMDWDENYIRLYVDDLLMNETELAKTINERGTVKNPMQQPHYIIINMALGGDNGGDISQMTLPRQYVIDYVRVYQKD